MAATKLIVTEKQKKQIKRYVKKGLTGSKIAKKMGVSQPTMYRAMEEMGLNKKRKKPPQPKTKIFNWKMFNGTVI